MYDKFVCSACRIFNVKLRRRQHFALLSSKTFSLNDKDCEGVHRNVHTEYRTYVSFALASNNVNTFTNNYNSMIMNGLRPSSSTSSSSTITTTSRNTRRCSAIPKRFASKEASRKSEHPFGQSTIDEAEVKHFSRLAELWWDEAGEFEALHSMNEIRVPLVRDALSQRQQLNPQVKICKYLPLEGLQIVDVGSGGGILSEPLARLGAFVTGLDASAENIKAAQAHVMHDPRLANNITYIQSTVEDLAATEAGKFDAVVASEVVEHVADVKTFVKACCLLVKPGGSLFVTTLNKTYMSYVLGVVGAENLLKLVTPGTHDWDKFISPQDLQYLLEQNDFSTRLLHGMMYNPLSKRWSWIKDTSINYALHAVKAGTSEPLASKRSDTP